MLKYSLAMLVMVQIQMLDMYISKVAIRMKQKIPMQEM